MSDVIRIIKTQKDAIEKLIPALEEEYNKMKPLGIPGLDSLIEHHKKAIKERDYQTILSILIHHAAKDLNIDITK